MEIMDNKSFFLKHLEAILAIASILAAGFFWIHTVDGLPDRVTKLESEVDAIKKALVKNDTKTDIILEDTKFIKNLIIQKHSN